MTTFSVKALGLTHLLSKSQGGPLSQSLGRSTNRPGTRNGFLPVETFLASAFFGAAW